MTAKTWLVTGCSGGFGLALAQVLIDRGEQLVATARDPATLGDLVQSAPGRVLALPLDVTRSDQIERAITGAIARFGRIDVLVNNAGGGHFGTVEDAPIDGARAMMETNFFGALALIKAVLPDMVVRRSGQIVNVGSVAGQIGFPGIAYYSASKFALSGLTESLAAEVGPLGVGVMLAELGPFATNFAAAMAMVPPSAHYDLAAASIEAGNSEWRGGDDPRLGAEALVAALAAPSPPRRLVLGREGRDVVELHRKRRLAEADTWLETTLLKGPFAPV